MQLQGNLLDSIVHLVYAVLLCIPHVIASAVYLEGNEQITELYISSRTHKQKEEVSIGSKKKERKKINYAPTGLVSKTQEINQRLLTTDVSFPKGNENSFSSSR
jgi:hypothetical protein